MGVLLNVGRCPFCGKGNNTACFATYDDGYCCFTCGKKKAGAYEFKSQPELTSNTLQLPENTTIVSQFSPAILEWLYGYYVFENLIRKHKIAYVPFNEFETKKGLIFSGEGVILPIYVNDVLELYQWRFFPDKQFITKGNKSIININYPDKPHKSKALVLCEDFISAIRLGELIDTMCLMGTSVCNEKFTYALKNYDHIIVWLDSDEAGQQAAQRIIKNFRNISTRWPLRPFKIVNRRYKQPKELSNTELKFNLEEITCVNYIGDY